MEGWGMGVVAAAGQGKVQTGGSQGSIGWAVKGPQPQGKVPLGMALQLEVERAGVAVARVASPTSW